MRLTAPMDLREHVNGGTRASASHWHPAIIDSLTALPAGPLACWGVPFAVVPPGDDGADPARWLLLGAGRGNERSQATSIGLASGTRASHLVFLHFCDESYDPEAGPQPHTLPDSSVNHPGQRVADYVLVYADGREHRQPIRWRFEINEPSGGSDQPQPGRGRVQKAFAARPDEQDAPLEFRGPYDRGAWGRAQTSAQQGSGRYWVYALPNPHPDRELRALRLEPAGDTVVAIAGITLYGGQEHPLKRRRLESFRIALPDDSPAPEEVALAVDLGILARTYRVPAFEPEGWLADPTNEAAGRARDDGGQPDGDSGDLMADITANADATLTVGEREVPLRPAYETGESRSADGSVHVELLTPHKTWVHAAVSDPVTGRPTPARVHFRAPDGRYFPPYGHRHEVNDNWFEDYGNDLKLGNTEYAYVDGTFQVELPVGEVYVELSKGFEYRPLRQKLNIQPGQRDLTLALDRPTDWRSRGWVTADTHVHFISPQTAWLQGQAEGLNLINLLASQWGDLFTNVGDITGEVSGASRDDTLIWVGTENRQHMLGHMSLLGGRGEPVVPMTASGPGESYLGDPTWSSLAEWAEQCRQREGVVVIPHFPNPYSEVVADIILGKIDAVEVATFNAVLDNYNVTEWYRFLNLGYRVAAVGGTDKMSAGMAVGAIRTYAHIADEPFSFDAWAKAVRAGRTFTTAGPLLDLQIEGRHPGDVIELPRGGGTLAVEVEAETMVAVDEIQVVVNGKVVARQKPQPGALTTVLRAQITVPDSAWIAARCTSSLQGWALSPRHVAAHTSPVYVVVDGAELFNPSDATYMLTMLEGGITWVDTLSTQADPETHRRVRGVFEQARTRLHERMHAAGHNHGH